MYRSGLLCMQRKYLPNKFWFKLKYQSIKCENALIVTPKALSESQDKRINFMLNKDKSMLWTPGTQSTTEEAAC